MAEVNDYRKLERPFVATLAGNDEASVTIHGVYRVREVWKADEDSSLLAWVSRTVASWDLTSNGEPVPLTKAGVEGMLTDEDLPLLRAVEGAIREDCSYPNLRVVKTA